jgi:predicted O-methyltransferase YrrM
MSESAPAGTLGIRAGLRRLLGPDVLGRIDLLRPSLREPWGGPLNGQERRREIVRELARAVEFDRVLETGTYRGSSTQFFATVFGAPVETVESNRRFFAYSRLRLRRCSQVRVSFGDSRTFLSRLAARESAQNETVFIYLDAHWEEDLPLAEELRIICSSWSRCVVMIDDFQVSGDSGYEYDDYGPGKALVEDYLPAAALEAWLLMYPTAPSEHETGARRGCCVLTSPILAEKARVLGLRPSRVL